MWRTCGGLLVLLLALTSNAAPMKDDEKFVAGIAPFKVQQEPQLEVVPDDSFVAGVAPFKAHEEEENKLMQEVKVGIAPFRVPRSSDDEEKEKSSGFISKLAMSLVRNRLDGGTTTISIDTGEYWRKITLFSNEIHCL
jgi:hypothetical protein